MQFKPELAQKILTGEKTQTRRTVKPGEYLYDPIPDTKMVLGANKRTKDRCTKYLTKWVVGQTYAIQPGRGKAAIGRFKLLDIRRERVQDITEQDAIAEGFGSISEFFGVFESINGKAALDKEVWVLTFEVTE